MELDSILDSDVDKVFSCLVRLLRNRNITQYIENHPSAYDEVLAAVQEIPHPKPLPTPATTPREDPVSKLHDNLPAPHNQGQTYVPDADDSSVETSDDSERLASLNIASPSDHDHDIPKPDSHQGERPLDHNAITSTTQRQYTPQLTSPKRKQHFEDQSASKRVHIKLADLTEGGPDNNGAGTSSSWAYDGFALRYYMLVHSLSRTSDIRNIAMEVLTSVPEADTSDDLYEYQLGTTEISVSASTLASLEKLRTVRLQRSATVIQKNLKARYYRRKYLKTRKAILLIQSVTRRHLVRKHTQGNRKIEAATTIQRVWRSRKQRESFDAIRNNIILFQATARGFVRRMETTHSWRQYRRKVVIVQSLWRSKCARLSWEKLRQVAASSGTVSQGDHEDEQMLDIPAFWRTQLQRIKSPENLEDLQHFCSTVRHPVTSIDVRPDQDALEQSGGPEDIPSRDRRLKQLKFLIEDASKKEKSLERPKIVLTVSTRMYLAELKASYEAEKALNKRGQPSAREKYVDTLFPNTTKKKIKQAEKGEKVNKANRGKKGKTMSDQADEHLSERSLRQTAERVFDYWLRIARLLWELSQCCGLSILAVLPQDIKITEDDVPKIARYIKTLYPGLEEQINNLSWFLPGVDAREPPLRQLVIETIPHLELSYHPFEELFQFSDRESSEFGDLPSEKLPQSSQATLEAVNNQYTDAVIGFPGEACAQSTIDAVQNIRPNSTSESLQSRSPSAEIKGTFPLNSGTAYSEFENSNIAWPVNEPDTGTIDPGKIRQAADYNSFK